MSTFCGGEREELKISETRNRIVKNLYNFEIGNIVVIKHVNDFESVSVNGRFKKLILDILNCHDNSSRKPIIQNHFKFLLKSIENEFC